MKLHRVHSLDSSQIRQLQTMVNKCTDSDGTRLSFPFDEADLFLYFEHDGSIVSAIAFIPIEGLLYECSAFTDPEFRGHGLFSGLLDAGIDELPEDSELIFYADKRNSARCCRSGGDRSRNEFRRAYDEAAARKLFYY